MHVMQSPAGSAARTPASLAVQVRKRAGLVAIDALLRGLSLAGSYSPRARRELANLLVTRNVPYRESGHPAHRLDIYAPRRRSEPLPTLLYVHGGGFRLLSKETHWLFGLAFARRGFVVANIEYRMAPAHRFPSAIDDVCAAFSWVVRHIRRYGGDPERVVLAGESAGANLVTALTVATTFQRPEPYARVAFDLGLVPKATLPACGILQVSDPDRFRRRRPMPVGVMDRIEGVSRSYLPRERADTERLAMADPLLVLESAAAPARELPPVFACVGTRDPILDDTRRLGRALATRGVPHEVRYYSGELHAFHALTWRPAARQCWRDMFAFLGRHVG
jgi:acetyl esterase